MGLDYIFLGSGLVREGRGREGGGVGRKRKEGGKGGRKEGG